MTKNPRLLLIEDEEELQRAYSESLKLAGFNVTLIEDGIFIEKTLTKQRDNNSYFQVILSDTDMPEMYGDEAIKNALEKKLLSYDQTLVIGMSEDHNNEVYWKGLAHHSGFYEKQRYAPISRSGKQIGYKIRGHYHHFETSSSPIWKALMLKSKS